MEVAVRHLHSRLLFVFAVSGAFFAFAPSAKAVIVDLTSGATGSLLVNQSFNGETRSADVSLLGGVDQLVLSMTVRDVDIRNASTLVGARIYSSAGLPLAAADLLVFVGEDQTINVPISATLTAGSSYRLAFFVPTSDTGNNGNLFDPNPPGAGGFGYVETQGLFRVNGGFQIIGDVFPTDVSFSAIPQIGVEVTAVPEPSSMAWLAIALGLLGLTYAGKRRGR